MIVKRMKIRLALITLSLIALCLVWGLPVFAQTYTATLIPGQPLATMAAEQIITNSRLPIEKTPEGETNPVTRGRDAVNAYRYAHTMLYQKGWYRGISEDHTPLLAAMVSVLEKEGYTTLYLTLEYKAPDVLKQFFDANEEQNIKDGTSWQ